ncbi:activated RNA polymerase II transcriptional coactivator p15 [Athalia rosae]|uniref:activated RNA polymerase II transcriptional coactivator p15 n=1 Tax=Athalia rosae TaxID=37344 RepID=UPI00203346F4|nr:activated RNA polymerase II transcriptional coactivator p15 [Athalia rosae]XP_048504936.1 activated RNA polymerase II transcriptional coactivator p15 [Athalia rosae]XP_048504937.1 activated RNA polymerase II transcriptional coactivator p15 [Athalia rosae]
MPKSKQYVESSSDSSSDYEPTTKKKTAQKTKRESSDDEPAPSKKPKKETKKDEDTVWDLGSNRQVTVREFKGKLFVDIREMYYDKDGDVKPGRKGICMNMAQWRKFMDIVADVDEAAKAKC